MRRLKERTGADVWVAMDVPSLFEANNLADKLVQPTPVPNYGYKLGLELCTAVGVPQIVSAMGSGVPKFVDLKLNDIPNTVGKTVRVLSGMGAEIINVMASAGSEAMRAAVANKGGSLIFAVTVLTSLSDQQCEYIFEVNAAKAVFRFATMATSAGVDGIICSPQDLAKVRPAFKDLLILTPGVRPKWVVAADDQKRIATPYEAIMAGADGIVIGRPVINPPEGITPAEALGRVLEEVRHAWCEREKVDVAS